VNDRAAYANANAALLPLADKSVHMIATSPPYWGLRSYDTGDQKHAELGAEPLHDCLAWARGDDPCGACYVCNLREWAAEMWRVLRDDGVMFLNLGDSYAAQRGGTYQPAETLGGGKHGKAVNGERVNRGRGDNYNPARNASSIGLKHKDLVGIPWRVALALQADGWTLRSDIIWAKPNPMPESVTDRPTKAHEYVFLLTKRARYFWDAEAVKEASAEPDRTREDAIGHTQRRLAGRPVDRVAIQTATRNLRTVWQIATAPYSGAHFATWPPALVERMVKAGTSERGVCPECGKPWRRVVDKGEPVNTPRNPNDVQPYPAGNGYNNGNGATTLHKVREVKTVEWRPTCTCNQDGLDLKPDDFEIILTPTGERAGDDPSLIVGRAGYNRPRDDNEGQRPITRYEQRRYAAQLRQSAARGEMDSEAGLRPGGYAAWVCKDFVRKGQRVPFSDQWQQLCEAVGFEPVERIAAMLVDDHGDQLDIFGGATARLKERKSFFRRLAEKKGSPRIDHEDVIIMRKPTRAHANGNGARSDEP
jgi:DNA modification methylase